MKVHNPNNLPTIPIADLIPSQGDLKDLTETNYKKLKNVIEHRGFSYPVYVWEDKAGIKHLLDGHQRQRVLKTEGWNEPIPYLKVPAENYQEAMARLLEITSQYATITQEGIDTFIAEKELNEAEVYEATSYDALKNYGDDEKDVDVEEDEAPEVDETEPPKSELGKIYQLGRHRVMCGDSTDKANVKLLMNGDKADMVFTDPPYGMDLDADYSSLSWGDRKGKKYSDVIGDRDDFTPELINTIFDNFGYCKEMFLWGADYYFELIPQFKQGHYIVWDKTLESNGDADSNSEFELLWTKEKHKRTVLHFNWFRYFGLGKQDMKTREHPTQKPLQVCTPIIEKYSNSGDIVADLFLGSGSTLIACEQTDRTCYGMELDPKYVDVIRKRYAKFIQPDDQLPENWEEITPAISGEKQVN